MEEEGDAASDAGGLEIEGLAEDPHASRRRRPAESEEEEEEEEDDEPAPPRRRPIIEIQ